MAHTVPHYMVGDPFDGGEVVERDGDEFRVAWSEDYFDTTKWLHDEDNRPTVRIEGN